MAAAIEELMPQGRIPTYVFDIPLIAKCSRISPIEGLHKRVRKQTADGIIYEMIPDKDAVPAVSLLCL